MGAGPRILLVGDTEGSAAVKVHGTISMDDGDEFRMGAREFYFFEHTERPCARSDRSVHSGGADARAFAGTGAGVWVIVSTRIPLRHVYVGDSSRNLLDRGIPATALHEHILLQGSDTFFRCTACMYVSSPTGPPYTDGTRVPTVPPHIFLFQRSSPQPRQSTHPRPSPASVAAALPA